MSPDSTMRRRQGLPVWLSADDPTGATAKPLVRLETHELEDEEGWLQPLLFNRPELLPVQSIEPEFGPPVAIARNVPVESNRIDLLVGSPRGRIALVETKLWRNHESKREVVAQALEYAKELQHWTYEILDRHVRRGTGCTEGVAGRLLRAANADTVLTEEDLRDAIETNLRSGRLLILIVGDRIRPEAEQLARWCERHLTLRWTLGLVELEVYRQPQGAGTLVVPAVVERIVEERRLVVTVEGAAATGAQVLVASDDGDEEPYQAKEYTPLDATALQHCIEQLARNDNAEVRARRGEYEGFLRAFYARAVALQDGDIAASFAPVGPKDTEAAMLLEIRGRRLGKGVRIAKCACWPKERHGAGVAWGMRQLFKWAQGDAEKTDRVQLFRQGVSSLITAQTEREQFEEQTAPDGRGDQWTPLGWFSAEAHTRVLDELERFCRAIRKAEQ